MLNYRAFINKSDHQVMTHNCTLWFAHQCNGKIYLWTDNATIGVIEPVDGIQFKHLDRQVQVYIWAASIVAVDIHSGTLYFSINYTLADVINNGEAGVSVGDILKYEVTWISIWWNWIKVIISCCILDCLSIWRNILWHRLCEVDRIFIFQNLL